MDTLTASQKQEYATSFAALCLYASDCEISSDGISTILAATNNEVEAYFPIIYSQFLTKEKIEELINNPGGAGGDGGGDGGDGGDGGGEEAKKEEVVEEEVDLGGGASDLFGGGDGGDY